MNSWLSFNLFLGLTGSESCFSDDKEIGGDWLGDEEELNLLITIGILRIGRRVSWLSNFRGAWKRSKQLAPPRTRAAMEMTKFSVGVLLFCNNFARNFRAALIETVLP
jgi:hypothetical protein